jgi:tetratricopeptide (TPR) repeat protein
MKKIVLAVCLSAPLLAQNFSAAEAQSFQAREAGKGDEDYQRGLSALDTQEWDDAIAAFNESASHKNNSAPAALYWKAYAQNKAGRRAEAMDSIRELRRAYRSSRWVNDAQTLEVEVQAQSGTRMSPGAEPDEELKMVALNSLMQSEPDQAIPILEKLLASNNSDKVKERALFVLVQSGSPKAAKMLGDMARGSANPNLQLKAIRYMGMMGNGESRKELSAVYAATSNQDVKRAILKSFMISGSRDLLFQAAKTEQNPELRQEAIRQLAISGGHDELWQLYNTETSEENKRAILKSMFLTGSSDKLADLARTEKNPALRADAIKSLGLMGDNGRGDVLVNIFKSDSNSDVRHAVLQALFLQNNGKALVELARNEKNPEMKQEIVQKMSLVHSKEVTDYMMEILR